MKSTTLLALVATLWAAVGHASEYWVSVSGSKTLPDNTLSLTYVAVDVSTIVYGEPERKAWFTVMAIEHNRILMMHSMRQAFRCNQRESATTQMVEFDPDTLSVTMSDTYEKPDFDSEFPSPLWQEMLAFVCAQQEGQPVQKVAETFYVPTKSTSLAEVKVHALNCARQLQEEKAQGAGREHLFVSDVFHRVFVRPHRTPTVLVPADITAMSFVSEN